LSIESYAVFGASGFGREVIPLVTESVNVNAESAGPVFVDDNVLGPVNGRAVMRYDEWIESTVGRRFISIAVANPVIRKDLALKCESDGVEFFNIRHSSVIELDSVEVGLGSILCPFVTLTSNVRIGRHFHCNIYSYVAHDCVIGDFVTFAPGVKCNGNVVIEDGVYVGTGAILKQGKPGNPLVIGRGAIIGMGAVVTRDVSAGATVVGNPARPMIRDQSSKSPGSVK
jgi:sugar O-acyltransferase (sialic acid O-acetyltransferase NeuD family)